ncbi:hypothetical protein SSX86_002986 [Deinandra increscens subsp. villosa]|uniref:Reverse transcriptase zinc-binding domain-containing protein n=1 Tax=Deinandra increscens subsp. villosa TaxID=3103831 RepID=A0AAP0HBU0_9ASTR
MSRYIRKDLVCRPKDQGGLGLDTLETCNLALLSKWFWKFLSFPTALWRRIIVGLHGLEQPPNWVKSGNRLPGVWSNIVKIEKVLFKKNVRLKELLVFDGVKWVWTKSPDSMFSISSIRKTIGYGPYPDGPPHISWIDFVPSKVNILLWRAQLGRLPTMECLVKRNVPVGSLQCPVCNECNESVDHIFTGCRVANEVWATVSKWCGIPPIICFSVKDLTALHSHIQGGRTKAKMIQAVVHTACWILWNARNNMVFRNKKIKAETLFFEIQSTSFFWVSHRLKKERLEWGAWCNFNFLM